MNKVLVDIENVSAGYEKNIVLKDISLKIYEQDFLGIIGPNGGGKTTLVKLILGLIRPLSGSISFAHKDLKNRIGYMPQTSQIDRKFPILVSEIIASGLMADKANSKPEQKKKVEAMIAQMGLQNIAHKPVGELSGGQLQRTLLARAIINSPELLILDEPNSYVDKPFEAYFYELLKKINSETAIILISHDTHTLLPMVKNVAYINEKIDLKYNL